MLCVGKRNSKSVVWEIYFELASIMKTRSSTFHSFAVYKYYNNNIILLISYEKYEMHA